MTMFMLLGVCEDDRRDTADDSRVGRRVCDVSAPM